MNLSIRQRLYVLAISPLLLITITILIDTYISVSNMNDRQFELLRTDLMEEKQAELKNYTQLAKSAIVPFLQRGATFEEALPTLQNLEFGTSGYIFGYKNDGTRVLLGKSDKGLGQNYWNLQDTKGNYFIRELVKNAGSAFTTYYFPKPGQTEPLPKLGYSIPIPEWDMFIGTGFYTDDIEVKILEMKATQDKGLNGTLVSIVVFSLIVSALVVVFAIFFNRTITSPLQLFDKSMARFATGDADLTARLASFSISDFNRLGGSFNAFVESLQSIIKSVKGVGEDVLSETDNMLARAERIDSVVAEQKEQTEQVAVALEEMTNVANEIANNANEAASAAKDADDFANSAKQVVSSASISVEGLASEVGTAGEVISLLEADVKNISSSLNVIQEIAEQTNLLALNAAIEAARAGEQGRGFSVVADEVRNLASRTQDSTVDIQKMIEKLQTGSDKAVSAMKLSKVKSEETVASTKAVTHSIDEIQAAVSTITQMNELIATATEEQSAVGSDISKRVTVISEQTNESNAIARENRSGSEQLGSKASELSALVGRFTV